MAPAGGGSEQVNSDEPTGRPGGVGAIWLMVLSVAGFGVATYLTTVHYANVPLACSASGLVDCSKVVTSQYSVVPGTSVPITVPGMAFFLVSLGLAIAQYVRPRRTDLRQAHFGWSVLGLLTVFYLVYVELVEIHHICIWCTAVHILILLTLFTTAWRLHPSDELLTSS
ncbi:MAG: vitamin K epoxide reductase family protein [Candidatus Dormibacteraeota bacterium]|nr:vitamin K epoxide reductase family protein [Candidatus Dormibacteraeota bacterium]